MKPMVRTLTAAFVWLTAFLATLWAAGALAFDLPWPGLRLPAAAGFALLALAALWRVPGQWLKPLALVTAAAAVAAWWFTLQPSHHRHWQPEVARLARVDVNGDLVTLHNLRNFDYRTDRDFTPRWETRTLNLAQLTGADIAVNYWGSPWMAHPIISFQFANAAPVCFSIETRKEVGEKYSAIGGLYRQFELIYIAADERDVIRLRTSFRKGEDVYLYRLTLPPAQARERFMEYVRAVNHLHERPQWYNAITTNCTTTIRAQRNPALRQPWDWRLLVNGKGDELMYEHGQIATGSLPFPELKRRARVNEAGLAAGNSPDFSRLIREGRPGF